MTRVKPGVLCAALASLAVLVTARAEAPGTITVAGRVLHASGQHTLGVRLWDADNFLVRPSQETRLAAGAAPRFEFVVRPGRWAVSAYEDRNEDSVLDMGLFGPKEPSGFSRPFRAWRKPRFEDVAVTIERSATDADVTLR